MKRPCPAARSFPLAVFSRRLGLGLLLCALVAPGCMRRGGALPLSPEALKAQLLLRVFAKALGEWDLSTINSLVIGGAAHPAWAAQRKSLEGRGIRFADVAPGPVRALTSRIVVGLVRFRLTGAGVVSTDRARAARVAMLKTVDGWRVSFWGTKRVIKRHLMWIAKGGDPLQDPLFSLLTQSPEAPQTPQSPQTPQTPGPVAPAPPPPPIQ